MCVRPRVVGAPVNNQQLLVCRKALGVEREGFLQFCVCRIEIILPQIHSRQFRIDPRSQVGAGWRTSNAVPKHRTDPRDARCGPKYSAPPAVEGLCSTSSISALACSQSPNTNQAISKCVMPFRPRVDLLHKPLLKYSEAVAASRVLE